jgi:hypothetical protein
MKSKKEMQTSFSALLKHCFLIKKLSTDAENEQKQAFTSLFVIKIFQINSAKPLHPAFI